MLLDIFTVSLLSFIIIGVSVSKIFYNTQSLLGASEGNFLLSPFPQQYLVGYCILMMVYNVLMQIPTSLVPMQKYFLQGGSRWIGHHGFMFACCAGCLVISFFVKNLIDLINFINLFSTPILSFIIPVLIKIKIEQIYGLKKIGIYFLLTIFFFVNFYFGLKNINKQWLTFDWTL